MEDHRAIALTHSRTRFLDGLRMARFETRLTDYAGEEHRAGRGDCLL